MKKTLSLISALVLCFSLCACGRSNNATNETLSNEITNDENITDGSAIQTDADSDNESQPNDSSEGISSDGESQTPSTEQLEILLSSSCDRLLAKGTDNDGNVFELVANETEDYNGTTIEIGVLKNNEWSIPLTTDSPFIGENGLLFQSYKHSEASGSIYDSKYAKFHYIGNGCFYYEHRIWNGNNGSFYDGNGEDSYGLPEVRINKTEWIVNNEGQFILSRIDETYKVLDTNTMQISDTNIKEDGHMIDYCFPCSEGLFACMNRYHDLEANGFYDLSGNKVIDLSVYNLARNSYVSSNMGGYSGPAGNLTFRNGKCTFRITNDQGTDYYITIDKTGTVIDSIEATKFT